MKILSMGICNSTEKNSQIDFDIFEGLREPIDLISIKHAGSLVPAKYIFNESLNLTITKFSGLLSIEEIKYELLASNSFSFLIFLFVEIFKKGTLIYFY